MRILSVGNMYPPHSLGGYEQIWASWVRQTVEEGHDHRVLTTDFRLEDALGGEDPGDVHRDLRWYWRDHDWPRPGARDRWAIERHNQRTLERHLEAFRPDAVAWWAMAGMSVSMIERVHRAGIPHVAQLCDYWLQYAQDVDAWIRMFAPRPRLGRVVERLTGTITSIDFAAADMGLVYVSEHMRRSAIASRPALAACDSEVLHTGPDLRLFRPADPQPWSWRLLYLGRMERRKGIDLAIESLAHLPEEATLTVVGSGDDDYRAELAALADRLGVTGRITFERHPRDEIPAAYAAADALLFPVRWEEPWGLVPLEAMAVGRPVVATGRGGSGEYLTDGENCLRTDPDDGPQALAARVRELADDAGLRDRLRSGGFATLQSVSEATFNAGMTDAVARRIASHEGARGR